MLEITPTHRATLKALSHPIKPVVWVGAAGLSEMVIRELDQALKSHELIKIKVSNEEREAREALLAQICERLGAAPVRHTGRTIVVYRPAPVETPGKLMRKNSQKTGNQEEKAQKAASKTSGKGKGTVRARIVSAPTNKDASRRRKRSVSSPFNK